MTKIAIFASGSGTNAENIISHFKNSSVASVELLLANTPSAYALVRAENAGVETVVFSRDDFYNSQRVLNILRDHKIDYLVLAGFLWLVPCSLTAAFAGRIINIHPALLPKFGGKGMYGGKVHEAVVAAGESESGITIHSVNDVYDSGAIIAQFSVEVLHSDTADDVAAKIHALEYAHFPEVIENEIRLNSTENSKM